MPTPEEQTAAMIENLPATTGRSLAEWSPLVRESGLEKHGQIVAMLKADYGLTYGYANLIALAVRGGGSLESDGAALVDAQYAGKKAALRPILDRILETVMPFGPDVDIAPKKSSVSLRRSKQFALVEPTTATRVDLGINLKGAAATGRLEEAGGMCTHRIRLTDAAEVDAEVAAWLREAYDRT
ncbi:MAG: DUF4287 domain-containing protein [Candidatus Limnocylindrales bacterium]